MRELVDRAEVVEDKVLYLATLLSLSSRTVVYSGAGLSTSCGVRQRGPGSCQPAQSRTTNARPSTAHLLLAGLVRAGLVQTWVTLSCDGEIAVSELQVEACCLLALVELRGRRGLVEQSWDLSVSSSQSLLLEQELIQEARRNCQEDQSCQLVAMAVCGRLRKVSLSQL